MWWSGRPRVISRNVVSLIIDSLQQLRQCRPVALSEESLVELAGQGRPPLLRPDRSRPGPAVS